MIRGGGELILSIPFLFVKTIEKVKRLRTVLNFFGKEGGGMANKSTYRGPLKNAGWGHKKLGEGGKNIISFLLFLFFYRRRLFFIKKILNIPPPTLNFFTP